MPVALTVDGARLPPYTPLNHGDLFEDANSFHPEARSQFRLRD
jgi:hypothetical protein